MRRQAFAAVISLSAALATVWSAHAQCRGTDRTVELKLSLGPGQSNTLVSQRIAVCVRHEYRLSLRSGQHIELGLTSPSNQEGMLTLVAPSGEKPVDGQNAFAGTVKETGTYVIEIGTDKTTSYTLKVSVR